MTQTIVMQKILKQKMMLQKFLCQKFLRKKFSVTIFCLFMFATVYSCSIYFCIFNKNDYLIKYAKKKRYENYDVINVQKFLHIYFCTCFFVYVFLYI